MSPRSWLWMVALLSAPVVQAQTAPVPSDTGYADEGREYADGDYDEDSDEEMAPMAPQPPPSLPTERPSRRPYAGAVWASGHWYWDGGEWRFNPGTWVAPMAGYQFVNGYWEEDRGSWYWVSGGWARQGTTEVEIPIAVSAETLSTQQAPPAPRQEMRPAAPSANLVWEPGYWYWSGNNWDWVDGTWAAPPRADLVFVSPRWVQRGLAWHFLGGGWAPRGSVNVTIPVFRHARVTVGWGHPNYFAHTWYRAPAVRYYYHRPWRTSGHYYRNDRVWRSPTYHSYWRDRGGPRHHDRDDSWRNRGNDRSHRDDRWKGQQPSRRQDRWRAPSQRSRTHDATPVGGGSHGHGRGRGRGDRH
ncbi:hypothetical protein FJV41_21710 [Myxococcus llanfairpwllgwyngyllgogerychwyrndrobwllllantysiliogogogochensis]|uniref:Lipoprotein n=1 Tax=Myxococcus llanfairpwllgwyngyllgogerychwyrndrobwllllantysiliogogogochensis TaxID=2590453 RepID=A0A540WXU5_9BACT|nr:YXWGXW repeat-containing protein [Myxococcus llanfairpwllgwyngyllgogerychwyrndrobwllllantysiliogogogochensis]TQF13827.1 hypothetical protein FJV41_21710 [Myxococcus llanfairpwllgwyngyllgogerychwyrndrobwllllantysiliogogogochensis]